MKIKGESIKYYSRYYVFVDLFSSSSIDRLHVGIIDVYKDRLEATSVRL